MEGTLALSKQEIENAVKMSINRTDKLELQAIVFKDFTIKRDGGLEGVIFSFKVS